jgi:hypothetical protein
MASKNTGLDKEIPDISLKAQSKPGFEPTSKPFSPADPTMQGDMAADSNQGAYIKEARMAPDVMDDAPNFERSV